MKYTKIFRMFGIAIILSLLVVALPATPAQAQVRSVTLTPAAGKIGDTITVIGTGFNPTTSADAPKYAVIYFSSDEAGTTHQIDDEVTHYKTVKGLVLLGANGEFTQTFVVPAKLDDGAAAKDVVSGAYYVYVCHYLGTEIQKNILYAVKFTITGGAITLDLSKGPVGSEVKITGSNFPVSQTITIKYDGEARSISSGETTTTSAGSFTSTISVPESTAGVHTITVTVSGSEVKAEFTVEPKITINPAKGEANTTVTVSGTGFGSGKEVIIYFKDVGVATAEANVKGSFPDTTFKVPSGLAAAIYNVKVDDGKNSATRSFTISVPTPAPAPSPAPSPAPAPPPTPSPPPPSTTASINPASGHIGSDVLVGGTGFKVGGTITVKYDDKVVATATAGANGIFVAAFKVPASKYGNHTIIVSDGTNGPKLTFTVESTPPGVPAPLLPEMGVKVKPPLTFDWGDVKDESPPVTYTLQVATDKDFSTASMVLERKGLTESKYAVTEEEKLKLVSKETPYYWRTRAIDGASNEGAWTGTGEFYVAAAFAMPSWALYILIGLGGLLLFIFGYWLGRRTAYY